MGEWINGQWESHGRLQCNRHYCPCTFEEIICAQSLEYPNDMLLVVTKKPNYKADNIWRKNMMRLSYLPNVVMFPMTTAEDANKIKNKNYYRKFINRQKKNKQRDHDDLGVLLLARILKKKYGSDRCLIVSEDQYRDMKIVANASPSYKFNIVKDSKVLFRKSVNPLFINSFTKCECEYWACFHKFPVLNQFFPISYAH